MLGSLRGIESKVNAIGYRSNNYTEMGKAFANHYRELRHKLQVYLRDCDKVAIMCIIVMYLWETGLRIVEYSVSFTFFRVFAVVFL